MYKSGYQSADLDAILGKAGVTKGALYHHFENKEALGYAVIEEVVTAMTREKWLRPLENARNPIDALIGIFVTAPLKMEDIRGGCPLNNLAQEMSSLHEGFRKRIAKGFGICMMPLQTAFEKGRRQSKFATTSIRKKPQPSSWHSMRDMYLSRRIRTIRSSWGLDITV